MKTLNGVVKKIGKTKLIGFIVILVVILGGVGGYLAYGQKTQGPEFTATDRNKLKNDKSNKGIIVFFSNDSDYSRAGSQEILDKAKKADFPVYYIDFDSPEKMEILSNLKNDDITMSDGLTTDEISKINTATLLLVDNRKQGSNEITPIQYADQVNGKYVPLIDNIKQAFDFFG